MPAGPVVVGLGEALFDVFPDGARLGGAPLNVAVHAHQLLAARGGQGVVVSRVGQDDLGAQVAAELRQRGMTADYLQTDPDRPTGRVDVDVDFAGQPSYDIALGAAYDNLQYDPDLEHLAATCSAVCFGTLAQRNGQSRNTIYRFVDAARRAFRLFDVNLRASPGRGGGEFYDARILRRSCESASAVKLNRDELPIVLRMLALPGGGSEEAGAQQLLKAFPLEAVALTRGADGTVLFAKGGATFEGAAAPFSPVPDADSVGAGDACSAALLVGRVLRFPPQRIVDLANAMGAFVAGQAGATPELPEWILAMARP